MTGDETACRATRGWRAVNAAAAGSGRAVTRGYRDDGPSGFDLRLVKLGFFLRNAESNQRAYQSADGCCSG